MNILASPLPREVVVGGARFPIQSGYRTGIQVARTVDAEIPDQLMAGTVLRLYYTHGFPDDLTAALEAVLSFHRLDAPYTARNRPSARIWDWDHDQGRVLADFRREYGIDLADSETHLHWWVFWTYFENLSADSECKRAMYYRATSKPTGMKGEEAKRFNALKKMYALPPRGRAEILAAEAAMWGDDE